MIPPYVCENALNNFLKAAFQEDIGDGDHSTLASVPANLSGEALLTMKDTGLIAGVELAKRIFSETG